MSGDHPNDSGYNYKIIRFGSNLYFAAKGAATKWGGGDDVVGLGLYPLKSVALGDFRGETHFGGANQPPVVVLLYSDRRKIR